MVAAPRSIATFAVFTAVLGKCPCAPEDPAADQAAIAASTDPDRAAADPTGSEIEREPPAKPDPVASAAPSTIPSWAIRPSRIAVGSTHTCVADAGGRVVCWGSDRRGQCGGTQDETAPPTVVGGVKAVALASGGDRTCALTEVGEAWCWGDHQGLGVSGPGESRTLGRVGAPDTFAQADTGLGTTCAVANEGDVRCWGRMKLGAARDESMHRIPVEGVVRIDLGPLGNGCAIDRAGEVRCWTWNVAAGEAQEISHVEGLPPIVDVGAGEGFACALGRDARVRCWGRNAADLLGVASAGTDASPLEVPRLGAVEQLAVGTSSSCARKADGSVWCWGENDFGQLGRPITPAARSGEAARVVGLPPAKDIDVGSEHACAIADDDSVRCWGRADFGQLGNLSDEITARPLLVEHVENVLAVATSHVTNCALTDKGEVACWNVEGEAPFRMISGISEASAVVAAIGGGCALVRGRARCWGAVAWKGHEPDEEGFRATVVPSLPPLVGLAAEYDRVCAIDDAGAVWCWGHAVPGGGSGSMEELGPVRVPGLSDAVEIGLSFEGWGCARRSDATVSCFRLADSESNPAAEPVAGVRDVVSIAVGGEACAVTDSSELWCWDDELSAAPRSRATSEPVRAVVMGYEHGCLLLADGRVECFGAAEEGQLGNGEAASAGIVTDLADVDAISAFGTHTCAKKTDGSVVCWGSPNPAGRGAADRSSTPVLVQLPG